MSIPLFPISEEEVEKRVRLECPITIYERGEYNQHLFFAMEYLDGVTLGQKLRDDAPIAPAVFLDILLQLLDVLAQVHQKGIVHRDIKPENVMLITRGGKQNYVILLDFGVAGIQTLSRLTQSGTVIGTLHYLAPEQILEYQFSQASDIYALGVVSYQMLTGVLPFSGETPLEVLNRIISKKPKRPKRPKRLNPDVPDALDRMVMQMLASKSDQRPSAAGLLQQLNAEKLKNEPDTLPFLDTELDTNRQESV